MDFEWDPAKNDINIRLRGIGFVTATRLFAGPVVERLDGRRQYGETRIVAIGLVDDVELVVVYTDRGDVRRIISVRRADRKERELWHAAFG